MTFDNSRTENLIGTDAVRKLRETRAAVFGIGGVGGYVCEALVRAGIGSIDLIDGDRVSESNLNRQIIATHDTVGMYKTEAMKTRILSVNPGCTVTCHNIFFLPGSRGDIDFTGFRIVADCVDTVSAKLEIITDAVSLGIPVISSMGAGNKLHPELFTISDIYKTDTDPLARVMRRELRNRGIKSLPVCWSPEKPASAIHITDPETGKPAPSSISFVPSAAGLIIAGWMVRKICGIE